MSVDRFLVEQKLGSKSLSIEAIVVERSDVPGGRRVVLAGEEATLAVLMPLAGSEDVEPGDEVRVSAGGEVQPGVFKAGVPYILAVDPFRPLVSKIRSAGVSVTPDPINHEFSSGLFPGEVAAYKVGARSETMFIASVATATEASAGIGQLTGLPGHPDSGRLTLYLFRPQGHVVGLFASPSRSEALIAMFSKLFGKPRKVLWLR